MSKSDIDLTHSMTHYLLTIHKLNELKQRTRSIDVANAMDMARSSVTTAIKKLKEKELVIEDEGHNLILTAKAHKEVHEVLSNRTLIYYFFKDFLKVSPENSEKDSCLLEHLISQEAQEKLFHFMKNLLSCSAETPFDPEEIKANLCLCQFNSLRDFKDQQVGDEHLPSGGCKGK